LRGKPKTKPLGLGFRLQWGCRRWRGVLCGYTPPSRANLGVGMGSEVVWVGGGLVVLTWHPFCFSSSSHPLYSSLPILNPPFTPLIGWVKRWWSVVCS
jgi:hypothetical protein